jgi:cellulose synthase/poly-beta-1,6-N-acetylglucosamine synthase-like glycosyltransferase
MILAWSLVVLSGAWVAFAYLGYPAILLLLRRHGSNSGAQFDGQPPISVIVAAHNAERELAQKLENTLQQEYPAHCEIIVASDASTDRTEEIAASFADRGVVLVRRAERGGKEAAQAMAIERASGDILVFTDVGARLTPDSLHNIIRPFADSSIGCVSSEDAIESSEGEGIYVHFEMRLRRLESEVASLIGLSGSFFAVRRELCDSWPSDLASDFRISLEAARRGLRAVAETGARAQYSVAQGAASEWRRKVRTVRRGIAVLSTYRDLLHPRMGKIALCLWGHKAARFTAPFALILLFFASAVASAESIWACLLLVSQLCFYATGALALTFERIARLRIPRVAGFFMLANASIFVAWGYHFLGLRAVTWQPTKR